MCNAARRTSSLASFQSEPEVLATSLRYINLINHLWAKGCPGHTQRCDYNLACRDVPYARVWICRLFPLHFPARTTGRELRAIEVKVAGNRKRNIIRSDEGDCMNLPGRDPGKEKVQCIRANTLPAVVTMPSRFAGAGAAVLQMPSRFHLAGRKAPVVIAMPSRSNSSRQRASVLEMPARGLSTRAQDGAQKDHLGLSSSLRMTLIALFALLGWPRPTRGKDPGAAAARPWKLELLNVISRLELPVPATGRGLAAQGAALEFRRPLSKKMGADLASAA